MSQTQHLQLGPTHLDIEELPWDSKLLARRCARLVNWSGPDGFPEAVQLAPHLESMGLEYVIARRPQSDWGTLLALQNAGFRVIDGLLTFERGLADIRLIRPNLTMRLATANDGNAAAVLAARSFTLSRFHNDPLITPDQAINVHREWAINSCLGKAADAVWLIDVNGPLAGFCTCRTQGELGEIALIAVDPQLSGQGLGQSLLQQALEWFHIQGCRRVRVSTQTNNLAAIGLYSSNLFRPVEAHFTLRWVKTA